MKELKNYYKTCELLKNKFLKELYPDDNPKTYGDYWIGDEIGGVLTWYDWFVTMEYIIDYFRYKLTPDMFFDWYDQWMDENNNQKINMRTYSKLNKHG